MRRGTSTRVEEEMRSHPPLALDVDDAALLELEPLRQPGSRAVRDMDGTGDSLRLHPARRVDRVTPQVVAELLDADHARHDGTDVDSDPELDPAQGSSCSVHGQGHV